MCVSVRVEGELLEVSGDKGAVFPFRVAEVSKRRVFVINLQLDEFRWLAREMVRFCSSKGEPLWVRTFKGRNHCLLLQLRRNKKGRHIVFSRLWQVKNYYFSRWLVWGYQTFERDVASG